VSEVIERRVLTDTQYLDDGTGLTWKVWPTYSNLAPDRRRQDELGIGLSSGSTHTRYLDDGTGLTWKVWPTYAAGMDGGEPIKSSRTEGDGGFGDVSRGVLGEADWRFGGLFTSLYIYINYIYTLRT